jgi:hypothetical protein
MAQSLMAVLARGAEVAAPWCLRNWNIDLMAARHDRIYLEIEPNELLEQPDGKRLECRPSIGAGNRNSESATVGLLDRTKDR